MTAVLDILYAPPAPPSIHVAGCAPSVRLVAIDIGRTGALALFTGNELGEIADMPTLEDGPACRPTVNGALLAALTRRWAPAEAVVEHVAARPGEAPSGAFAFGRSRGVIEGVLADQGIPIQLRTPSWWKRRVGIPAGRDHKDTARSVAISRWPGRAELFAREIAAPTRYPFATEALQAVADEAAGLALLLPPDDSEPVAGALPRPKPPSPAAEEVSRASIS